MKCLFVIFLLALFVSSATAQTAPQQIDQALWRKAKNQRTAGFVLLGVGGAVTAIGLAVGVSHFWEDVFNETHRRMIPTYVGLGLMASSVPFFVAAGKNRRLSLRYTGFQPPLPQGQMLGRGRVQGLQLTLTQTLFK